MVPGYRRTSGNRFNEGDGPYRRGVWAVRFRKDDKEIKVREVLHDSSQESKKTPVSGTEGQGVGYRPIVSL